jgi:hypothetical protein
MLRTTLLSVDELRTVPGSSGSYSVQFFRRPSVLTRLDDGCPTFIYRPPEPWLIPPADRELACAIGAAWTAAP